MTFLPIVERELRVASRRRGTYWSRFGLVLTALLIWFLLLATSRGSSAERGQILFVALGVCALGFCMLAGVFLTADCLSEEKREGTLGLLFLTELKGYDVVFGKLMATSLHAFYGLLAVLPLLSLSLLMGGVTAGEFWRVTLVLIVTIAQSLSVGMLVSGFCRETRQAMALTLLGMILLAGVLPILFVLKAWILRGVPWDWLLWASPPYLYSRAFDNAFTWRSGVGQFWSSLLTICFISVCSLVTASLALPRFWQEKSAIRGQLLENAWWHRLRFGTWQSRLQRRMRLSENPYYWLAARDRASRWIAAAMLGGLLPVWCCFFAGCASRSTRTMIMSFYVVMFMAYGFHLIVKWLIAMEASRRLSEDRRSGALELLLVTPLNTEQILLGQRRALWENFRGPMAMALASNVALFWIVIWPNLLKMPGEAARTFCEVLFGGAVLMLVDFYALSWVGMWQALRTRKHHRAILGTLARVLLAPWLAVFFLVLLTAGGGIHSEAEIMLIIMLWFGLGATVAWAFAARAKMGLREELASGGRIRA